MSVSLNHTGITVASLDESIALFEKLFGFTTTSRAPRDPDVTAAVTGVPGAQVEIAYLANGDATLELIEYSGPQERAAYVPRPCDLGSVHVAFTVDDIAPVLAQASAFGLTPIGETVVNRKGGPNQGAVIVYLRARDGVMIEIIQRPRPATNQP